MILNFKTQINGVPTNFKEKILSGQKIHTIRKKGRWKAGDTIHFSTGARSKNYECFNLDGVKCVQSIEIKLHDFNTLSVVKIDGREVGLKEQLELAKNDGFDSHSDFKNWFKDGGEFDLIHWTDKKY